MALTKVYESVSQHKNGIANVTRTDSTPRKIQGTRSTVQPNRVKEVNK
jgi:hypothetical protein